MLSEAWRRLLSGYALYLIDFDARGRSLRLWRGLARSSNAATRQAYRGESRFSSRLGGGLPLGRRRGVLGDRRVRRRAGQARGLWRRGGVRRCSSFAVGPRRRRCRMRRLFGGRCAVAVGGRSLRGSEVCFSLPDARLPDVRQRRVDRCVRQRRDSHRRHVRRSQADRCVRQRRDSHRRHVRRSQAGPCALQ